MDILSKFLHNIAYKFPKGYPDLNNDQDILILENELKKLGVNLKENNFNSLTFFDLKKRGGYRFADLAKKIEEKLPFSIVGGESTPLQFIKPEYAEVFLSQDADAIKKLSTGNINQFPFFKDDSDKQYNISDLEKDPYFGGKGSGSGTVVEDANLQILNNQILKLVEENGGPINVKVGDKIYKNIIKAKSQFGTPKSDFNLIDENDNPVVFISHKKAGGKGPDAKDFIRWSGYTIYADHPEVKKFNQALEKWIEENNPEQGVPRSSKFIAPVQDPELIRKLIYGPKYGGEYGPDNINIILQGKITLKHLQDNNYELSAQHELLPPELPEGEYQPYLTAAYRGDRNMFGIKHNEAIVMTKAIAFSSSNLYELKGDKFEKLK
jgi:hypothetical protein